MATDPNAAAATPATAAKPKTVIEGMDSRRMFLDTTSALAYLNKAGEDYADFANHPQIIKGLTVEGEGDNMVVGLDPTIYTPDTRVMVAVLANRGEKKDGKAMPSTVKAIVATPVPTLDAILADESGRKWLEKIVDTQLNHVAVRALRAADDVEAVADQMPLTLADYIASGRESSGGIMETFNTLFKGIIAALAAKSAPWAKARLTKAELKKAFESRAYALEFYSKLEDRGDKPSLFVMALQFGVKAAKEQGLDPAIFDKWLNERNEKVLNAKDDSDAESDDFDLDDLAFVADEKADDSAAPAATGTATE